MPREVPLPPEAPSADATLAHEALRAHGTPMRLLELFYIKLNVRLVIFSGKTCRYVHTPFGWELRSITDKHTVVLNVWSNHVFTYNREVHNRPFQEHAVSPLPEVSLVPLRDPQDRYPFGDMIPLDWAMLLEQ